MIEQESINGYMHLTGVSNKLPIKINKNIYHFLDPEYSNTIAQDEPNLININNAIQNKYLKCVVERDENDWTQIVAMAEEEHESSYYCISEMITLQEQWKYGLFGLVAPEWGSTEREPWSDCSAILYDNSGQIVGWFDMDSFGWGPVDINGYIQEVGARSIRFSINQSSRNTIRFCRVETPSIYAPAPIFEKMESNHQYNSEEYSTICCNNNMFSQKLAEWNHEFNCPLSFEETTSTMFGDYLWTKDIIESTDYPEFIEMDYYDKQQFIKEQEEYQTIVLNDSGLEVMAWNIDDTLTKIQYKSTIGFPAGDYYLSADFETRYFDSQLEEEIILPYSVSAIEIKYIDPQYDNETEIGRVTGEGQGDLSKEFTLPEGGKPIFEFWFRHSRNHTPESASPEFYKMIIKNIMFSRTPQPYVRPAVSKAYRDYLVWDSDYFLGSNEYPATLEDLGIDPMTNNNTIENIVPFKGKTLYSSEFEFYPEYSTSTVYVFRSIVPIEDMDSSLPIFCQYLKYVPFVDSSQGEFISNRDGFLWIGLFASRAGSQDPEAALSSYYIDYRYCYYGLIEPETTIESFYPYKGYLRQFILGGEGNEINAFFILCPTCVGNGCFDGNTIIHMEDKEIAIKLAKKGDKILSLNKRREQEYQPIEKIIEIKADSIMSVITEDEEIRVTRDHNFYTEDGVILAKDIKPGMKLISLDNKFIEVKKVSEKNAPGTKVYTLQLKNNNNYFVGKDKILVQGYENRETRRKK